jgi:hypothetical protein
MEPLNPFWPITDTAKVELDVPAMAEMASGESAMLKSGPGVIVSVRGVEWLRDPELPVAVTV